MKLTLEQMKEITLGALNVEVNAAGEFCFYRFTEHQMEDVYIELPDFYKKSKAAAYAAKISARLNSLIEISDNLETQIKKAEKLPKIIETMAELRKVADEVEGEVSNELWTLPKYCEMLFVY